MQTVDETVSRMKFDREVEHLRAVEQVTIERGWWIIRAEFPAVKVAFCTTGNGLRIVPFAVLVDFTDYDVKPLSIKFVDPFVERELLPGEMMTKLANPEQGTQLYQHYQQHPMIPGFLCLPGVREYHEHPAHSGDPWEMHRTDGGGRLFALLETIWRHGTMGMQLAINVGFTLGAAQPAAPMP